MTHGCDPTTNLNSRDVSDFKARASRPTQARIQRCSKVSITGRRLAIEPAGLHKLSAAMQAQAGEGLAVASRGAFKPRGISQRLESGISGAGLSRAFVAAHLSQGAEAYCKKKRDKNAADCP